MTSRLPPFDPAKMAPAPHEDEIRAFIEELRKEREQKQEDERKPNLIPLDIPVVRCRYWWVLQAWGRK